MSDTAALFAHLVRDLCGLWLDAHTLPLDERITATYRGLGLVVASAAALPVLPGRAPGLASPMLVDWPGLGAYEAYWRETDDGPVPMQASQTVEVVFQQLWAGLEQHDAGDVEKAVGTWGAGFETLWGPAALELLRVLQPAVLGYRADARASFRPVRREASPLVMVGGGTREPVDDVDDRPTLGLRIQPVAGGVEVLAVHPGGPAAGRLLAGDVLLTVDGEPLDGLEPELTGPALAGTLGAVRVFEVYRAGETLMVRLASVPVASLG